jgi:hypothetical protein
MVVSFACQGGIMVRRLIVVRTRSNSTDPKEILIGIDGTSMRRPAGNWNYADRALIPAAVVVNPIGESLTAAVGII